MEPNGGGDDVSEPAVVVMPDAIEDDRAEFEQLLRAQAKPLRRMVEQVSGSVEPDDVEQEFVLRAFRYRRRVLSFPNQRERCAWSRTVARNIAFKMFGSTAKIDFVAEVPDDALVAPDLLEAHLAADQRAELRAALDTLDPTTRHVVVERAINDTPYAELAEQLGEREDNLRKRYSRACDQLRATLTRAALSVLPARWVFRPARPTDHVARTAGYPAAVSTVMAGVLALTFAMPNGAGPLGTPPANAADEPHAAASRSAGEEAGDALTVPERKVVKPTSSPRAQEVTATPAAQRPAPQDSEKPDVQVCVQEKKVCVGPPGSDPEAPGDEVFVEAPQPVGHVGVKQNGVKVCDTVPDLGSAGCRRHE